MSGVVACGTERLHGNYLVLMCCVVTDDHLCVLDRLLVGSSVYIRNGCLWLVVMPPMCVSSGRACTWEGLLLMWLDAIDVRLERVLVEWSVSVYMGT